MSPIPTTQPRKSRSPRDQFLDVYEDEHARTMRVLRAYPNDQAELRPHPKCKTARELAWMFVMEQGAMETAMTTGFDFSQPLRLPPAPESFDAVLQVFDETHQKIAGLIRGLRDDELYQPLRFMIGPGKIGDVPLNQVLWFMLHDQIHHRGQFSIYLRIAGGKVPSIYGPSADEPWA
jgi:uncharacterized damage-inducible protein DinB